MKLCEKCKSQYEGDIRFCPSCGTQLKELVSVEAQPQSEEEEEAVLEPNQTEIPKERDTYYDDVLPDDYGVILEKPKIDKESLKKALLLICASVIIIGLSIFLLLST